MRHPGVVHVLGTGTDARGRFLVLSYVAGETLRAALARDGAAPEPLVRRVGTSLAGGLAALHAAGFVHGDVKPENVRLDAEGTAVLLDLGFAREIAAAADTSIAPRAGSLPYVAPEVAQGGAGGPESDVFALGVVLYELSTGVHPFAGEAARGVRSRLHASTDRSGSSGQIARTALTAPDADRLLAAIATARFVPPSRFVPQISPVLDRSLEDALRRDPARRPSAAEFAARWREAESGTWWRGEVDFAAGARRSTAGETDASSVTPLVGRARELDELLSAWERSATAPQSVWMRGPAGAGKTRLVHEFTARVRTSGDPPLVLSGRSRALEQDRPCQPILRMLERYLRLAPGAKPGARDRAELAGLVPPGHVETLLRALDPENTGESVVSLPLALGEWIAALARRG
ncbi:MAG: serine/threonine-protein kinase PknK, partial [Planctomycetes bacterium]|nr:serine/threonine-protein kinase PknK [Planctomycetota bacterium]